MPDIPHWSVRDAAVHIVQEGTEEEIKLLIASCTARRQHLRDIKIFEAHTSLYVGDRVKIVGNITPAYWIGAQGKIIAWKSDDTVTVHIEDIQSARKRHMLEKNHALGSKLTLSPVLLQKVEYY